MDEKGKEEFRSLVGRAVDTAILPFRIATSTSAQKAYLGTVLFALTSLFLLCISSVAYGLFYYNYIPQVGVDRVIHLQFGNGHPYGLASTYSALTSQQAYEVTVSLTLPRTPSNLAAGNFMIDLSFLAPTGSSSLDSLSETFSTSNTSSSVLARSRRPAILTYSSPVVNTASTFSNLPWYVLGWRKESEALEIIMFEGVEFAKGSTNIPDRVRLSIEADEKMQFYEAGIQIVARFGGLRWILYHHRILSFVIFTTTFWSSSMLSMIVVWFILSSYYAVPPSPEKIQEESGLAVKSEPTDSEAFDPISMEDLSDTSRTFPTLGRQQPLRFSRRKQEEDDDFKKEKDDLATAATIPSMIANEADDEEDDDDPGASEWRDSGIGTSREEQRWEDVRRRRKALLEGGAT